MVYMRGTPLRGTPAAARSAGRRTCPGHLRRLRGPVRLQSAPGRTPAAIGIDEDLDITPGPLPRPPRPSGEGAVELVARPHLVARWPRHRATARGPAVTTRARCRSR